jgi:hypothetical protein
VNTAAETEHLPEVIRSYLGRSLPHDPFGPTTVRVQQSGEMWKKPGARPMHFEATEDFAVDRVAFTWRARFPIVEPLAMTVVDEFADGEGRLRVSLFGPMQTQIGPETNLGEAMRYLAELAWAPQAIAANRELEWREIDDHGVEVSCDVAQARARVRWATKPATPPAPGVCGPSPTARPSCPGPGAATSASTRASEAHACRLPGRHGGSYPRAASSTGAGASHP